MWRSIAVKASLARHCVSKLSLLRNHSQVLRKYPNPCASFVDSAKASPRNLSCQAARHFSQSSSDSRESESEDDGSQSGSTEVKKNSDAISTETHLSKTEGLALGMDATSENIGAELDCFGSFDESMGGIGEQSSEIDAEKLEKALSLLQSSVDGSLESSLGALELSLTEDFVLRVLETPLIPGEHLLRFFKWVSENKEFLVTTPVVAALVHGVCLDVKRKEAYALWDLIKEIGMRQQGLLNPGILNELIASFSRLGKGKAGYEVFNKFDEFGCIANAETYYFTMDGLCRRKIYDWAWSVCEKMFDARILPDSEKIGEIISLFCKGNRAKEAHGVYLQAKGNARYPPSKAVNFLISRLSQVDETVVLALKMLDDLADEACKGSINQYSRVIKGLCRTNKVDEAKGLLLRMIERGPHPGNAVFNFVIGSLSKAGEMKDAMEMLRLMERRGLKPDVYTYSVIMSGYAKGGSMDDACKVLAEAKKKHSKLCPATYHTLVRGYCKLKDYDKALKVLGEMKDYGVKPNVDEYNKLIQSLCLEGLDWKTAEKLLGEMKENGLFLPGITRALINAVKELEEETLENVGA